MKEQDETAEEQQSEVSQPTQEGRIQNVMIVEMTKISEKEKARIEKMQKILTKT